MGDYILSISLFQSGVIVTPAALEYTISLYSALCPGLYVDGTTQYIPAPSVICGVATPATVSSYAPEVNTGDFCVKDNSASSPALANTVTFNATAGDDWSN